jgi:hypothetical protein
MANNLQFNGSPGERNAILWAPWVNQYANQYKLDPNFLGAIIHQESHWTMGKTSSAGAYGLGQLMPENQPSDYRTGGPQIQIKEVAQFLAKMQIQGRNGVQSDENTCQNYYGARYPHDTTPGGHYYTDVEASKSMYLKYDIPIVKNSTDKTNNSSNPITTTTLPRVSIKDALSNLKVGIIALPTKIMTLLGISALGLIALLFLISQSHIDTNEEV